ncbi:hypothetical protein M5K25_013263 [Dendrobium thyrsiflorum]|uniref:Uncharacterized protein n=1 Tax=Dendrobium thyrsiflorum TaxID=117978 RepID=A0ABD0USQ4_DENTH
MGDPNVDHGFVFDDQGRTDVLASPFFDLHFSNDETADDYVDRILYQLTLAIEAQIPLSRWYIVNTPPSSSNLATSLATTTYVLCCPYSYPTHSVSYFFPMESETIQWTLDLILDFRRQTGERLGQIERFGHPALFPFVPLRD